MDFVNHLRFFINMFAFTIDMVQFHRAQNHSNKELTRTNQKTDMLENYLVSFSEGGTKIEGRPGRVSAE